MRSSVTKHLCRWALCSVALAVSVVAGTTAWAHIDPPGASQSGAGQRIGLFTDSTCSTSLPGPILSCQTIYVRTTLVWTGGVGSSFEQGAWTLQSNNGVDPPNTFADLIAAQGGPVPCVANPATSTNDPSLPGGRGLCAGKASEFASQCVPYTPTAGDIAQGGATIEALWGNANPSNAGTGYTHRSTNDNAGASATASEFVPITSCPLDQCNVGCVVTAGVAACTFAPDSTACDSTPDIPGDCRTPGCESGVCVATHIPEPDSTACTTVADIPGDCKTPGCESGVCVAAHIPEPDSTACTTVADIPGDCKTPGCESGVCVAAHIPEPDSTVCTTTPDIPGDCRTPGCEAGVCVATHLPEPDSTVCTTAPDLPGDCKTPGCEAGVCVSAHIPEPDSTVCTFVGAVVDDCRTPGCESGVCIATHVAKPDSTPCSSVADIPGDCKTPGCESGVCVATHINEPDSTACTTTADIPGDCKTPGCESGVCVATHIPEPDSTACTTTADIPGDCRTPGCESGVCVATHIPEPDSTACTSTPDIPGDCRTPGCESGVCVATHIPEPDSTACTTTADIPGDCKTPGCESGVCVATHINEPDSTPCTDTGNACFNAGCEAGSCSQTHVAVTCSSDNNSCTDDSCDPVAGCIHTCNPTGKPECSLTIGDYIWNDANHDGIQEPGAGIGGVTISLHDCTTPGSDVTTTTAADGSYSFTVTVNPTTCTFSDNYQITVTDTANVLNGYTGSPADVGSDDTVDSDCVNKQIACQPYTGTDLTEDCGFFKAGPLEVCRTPGFWGTHGGTEKKKSNNITQQVLDQAGGLHVCGHLIDDTDPKPPNFTPTSQSSALEAICVSPQGAQVLQLARQLTAAALNCVMSQGTPLPLGSHADPSICGGTDIATLWTECDDLCAFNGPVTPHGLDIGGCINALDCFNNGGLADATGNCGPNPNGNCHNRDLCQVDASGHPIPGGICYPDPGPAGSSDACNAARDNNCTIIFGHCSHP